MSLADIVRSAVAQAASITASLQADVTMRAWISDDSTGKPTYDDPVTLKALVERKHRMLRTVDDKDVVSETKLTFIVPIEANGAANRVEPIDPRDRFTMQDGTTGPIVRVDGIQDAGYTDGRSFLYEVYLGPSDARLNN